MSLIESIVKFLVDGYLDSQENFFYNETRDQSTSRLPKWYKSFGNLGLSQEKSAILTAVLGELTNNSFDHNLGKWTHQPGCVVGFQFSKPFLKLYVVDRGQGIISSLKHSSIGKLSGPEILRQAFEERISGRSPEKRGNGLKFVVKNVKENSGSLYCFSQGLEYQIGQGCLETQCKDKLPKNFGTLILISWNTEL